MIDLADAIGLVEQTASPLPPRRQRLLDAAGRRLAEPVVADVDSPPWDRAMMDGFAVRSADVVDRAADVIELEVVADLAAGDVTTRPIPAGGCARIMTGAPIPPCADGVGGGRYSGRARWQPRSIPGAEIPCGAARWRSRRSLSGRDARASDGHDPHARRHWLGCRGRRYARGRGGPTTGGHPLHR
jgi:hypothetical protein